MSSFRDRLTRWLVTPEVEKTITRIPTSTGSFGYDAWGYHPEGLKVGMSIFKYLYQNYFRVSTHGLEHIPAQGRVMIVGNHSGQLPLDGGLIATALALNSQAPRAARIMVERWFPAVPYIGNAMMQMGAVLGDPVNVQRMLRKEEAVIVFPEGVRGVSKLFKERYQLKRFSSGFMHMAMSESTPIVPVGVVGCEESMPSIGRSKTLARLFGMPYFSVTSPIPLPTKVILTFGEPITFDENSDESISQRVERVQEAVRVLINRGLTERDGWFS